MNEVTEKSYLLGDEVQRRTVTKEYAQAAIMSSAKRMQEKAAGVLNNDTPPSVIEELGEVFEQTCRRMEVDPEKKKQIWDKVSQLLQNPSMAKFCEDTKAMESEFFPMWLCTVPRAVALEVAYGYSTDLNGKHRPIPDSDPLAVWVDEPVFKYLRYRDSIAAKLLHGKELLFLGAGWLPELRFSGFLKTRFSAEQKFYCCDQDPEINLKALLEPEILESFDYRLETMDKMLAEMQAMVTGRGYGFNTVVAKGVLSYQLEALPKVVQAVMDLLEPNGVFIFDLQLKHWTLVRNALLFNWSAGGKFKLLETVIEAINVVQESCLGTNHFEKIVIQPDEVNDEPVGVVFTVRK